MRNWAHREAAWWIAIVAAAALNIACIDGGSSYGDAETLTATECTDRGGEALEQASCPRGRNELGALESDAGKSVCCKAVPRITLAQCEALGGRAIGDPGTGETHRNGCSSGETMLGSLDFGIEGGICCK